jgi:hypothetical protein
MEFICECSRSDCTVRLEVKQDEYAAVRAKPTHFLVHHGHEDLRFERVVRTTLQYLVVEKTGEAGEVAEAES